MNEWPGTATSCQFGGFPSDLFVYTATLVDRKTGVAWEAWTLDDGGV